MENSTWWWWWSVTLKKKKKTKNLPGNSGIGTNHIRDMRFHEYKKHRPVPLQQHCSLMMKHQASQPRQVSCLCSKFCWRSSMGEYLMARNLGWKMWGFWYFLKHTDTPASPGQIIGAFYMAGSRTRCNYAYRPPCNQSDSKSIEAYLCKASSWRTLGCFSSYFYHKGNLNIHPTLSLNS